MHENRFIHCGLRHWQLGDMSVEVDQVEYTKNPNCIDEKGLNGMSDDDDPPEKHVSSARR
eukprot:9209867-Pyramimonas_sp.AAC.1